jgi:hypothetical protein
MLLDVPLACSMCPMILGIRPRLCSFDMQDLGAIVGFLAMKCKRGYTFSGHSANGV